MGSDTVQCTTGINKKTFGTSKAIVSTVVSVQRLMTLIIMMMVSVLSTNCIGNFHRMVMDVAMYLAPAPPLDLNRGRLGFAWGDSQNGILKPPQQSPLSPSPISELPSRTGMFCDSLTHRLEMRCIIMETVVIICRSRWWKQHLHFDGAQRYVS